MLKVKKLSTKALKWAEKLSNGMTYGDALRKMGNPADVYDFLNTLAAYIDYLSDTCEVRFVDNWPWLQQLGEEGEEWQGQPIVCDGWFELKDGELWFSGNKYTHGSGGPVSRKIMKSDVIDWQRCEPMERYRRGE